MSSERKILKQAGLSRVVPIAVWVFCVLACGDAIIEGTARYVLHTILAMAAVALAIWIVLFSPYFAVDAEGITIVNPIRVVKVPFGALLELKVGVAVSVLARYAGGRERKVTSWNAPGIQRRGLVRSTGGIGRPGAAGMATSAYASSAPGPGPSPVTVAVDNFQTSWDQAHPAGDPTAVAMISLRWREWLALIVLIGVNVAIRLR